MRVLTAIVIVTCLAAVTGCKSATTRYLEEAKGQATQDDVVQRFGPPYAERVLSNGATVWSYRSTGASYDKDGGRTYCGETILTFNDKKVLQTWYKNRC